VAEFRRVLAIVTADANDLGGPDRRQQRGLAQATHKAQEEAGSRPGEPGKRAVQRALERVAEQQRQLNQQASQMQGDGAQRGLQQARAAMEDLLRAIVAVRDTLTPRVPLLVKIAPDLSEGEIDDVLAALMAHGVDGVIATNTTVTRDGIPSAYANLKGGLSGQPLRARSTGIIRYIAQQTHGRLPIIAVGGIASGEDALAKLHAGASLVQVFTGMIYEGPSLVKQINSALLRACERDQVKHVHELAAV